MINSIELKAGENHVEERMSFKTYVTSSSKPKCRVRGTVLVPDWTAQSLRPARPATTLVLSMEPEAAFQLASDILRALRSANIELPKES
jgi:hypothetical protein